MALCTSKIHGIFHVKCSCVPILTHEIHKKSEGVGSVEYIYYIDYSDSIMGAHSHKLYYFIGIKDCS